MPLGSASDSLPLDPAQLLWALLLPVALIFAGVLWLGLVRREARRQSQEVSRRTAELEAWYHDLFDNAHDILMSLDVDGRLKSLNHAGRALLGDAANPDRHAAWMDLVASEDRAAFRAALEGLRAGGATAHGEFALMPGKGPKVFLRLNLQRLAVPGRPVEIRGVAWDVTEQRSAENALRESEQRLRYSLEERIRIGRDLHDGIIQSIYAVGLALGECRRRVLHDPEETHRRLGEMAHDLNGVIREVRGFIEGLEPEALKGSELRTALEAMMDRLVIQDHMQWSLDVDGEAANLLSAQQSAGLLQISREAVSNAVRHSGGTRVRIRLNSAPDGIALQIVDDGKGFNEVSLAEPGLGLRNLRARAEGLGGRCIVDSTPGQGTRIEVTLPAHGDRDTV